jgi:hypothetical protein
MTFLLMVLLSIVSFVCGIIILIDAFKNEVWKGIVGLLCGLYLLYYAFAEYESEKKTLIVAGWLIPSIISGVLYFAIIGSMVKKAVDTGQGPFQQPGFGRQGGFQQRGFQNQGGFGQQDQGGR